MHGKGKGDVQDGAVIKSIPGTRGKSVSEVANGHPRKTAVAAIHASGCLRVLPTLIRNWAEISASCRFGQNTSYLSISWARVLRRRSSQFSANGHARISSSVWNEITRALLRQFPSIESSLFMPIEQVNDNVCINDHLFRWLDHAPSRASRTERMNPSTSSGQSAVITIAGSNGGLGDCLIAQRTSGGVAQSVAPRTSSTLTTFQFPSASKCPVPRNSTCAEARRVISSLRDSSNSRLTGFPPYWSITAVPLDGLISFNWPKSMALVPLRITGLPRACGAV